MNPVIQAMRERRSIRAYRPDPVPKELLDQVLEAGLYAPTGMGAQRVITVAVTDPALRDRLAEVNRQTGGWKDEGFDPFYGAPAVLIVLAEADSFTNVYDGSLVMANLMLAAHALGLGSCWIHRAKEEFERPEFQALLKDLGIPGDYIGVGHCILGWPAGPLPEAAPRKEGRVFYADGAQ